MANLLEHTMVNKLADDIADAIVDVGGNVDDARCPMDYPGIIRDQLSTNGAPAKISLEAGQGVTIEQLDKFSFKISSNTGAETISLLNPPEPNSQDIPAGTSVQTVLEKLFDKILPEMPSVFYGDIIKASEDGKDHYYNSKLQQSGIRTGLDPNDLYIRIFVASRKEPIYIDCSPLKLDELNNPYQGSIGDDIDVNVNDDTKIITATLKNKGKIYAGTENDIINVHVDNDLDIISAKINENNILTDVEASNIFDKIFNIK